MSTALALLSQDKRIELETAVLEKKPIHVIAKQFGLKYTDAIVLVRNVREDWITNFSDRKAVGAQLEAELDHLRGKAYAMLEEVSDVDGEYMALTPKEKLEVIKVIGGLIKQHADMIGNLQVDESKGETKKVGANLLNIDEDDFKSIAEATARALSKSRSQGQG
jgi:hypothetical protein